MIIYGKKTSVNACYGLTLSRLRIVPAALQRFRVARGWMWILWWKNGKWNLMLCFYMHIQCTYIWYLHTYLSSYIKFDFKIQTTNIHAYFGHAETLLNARRMASTVELVQPFEGVVDVRWHEGRKPWSFRVCKIWNAMRWRCRENCNCNWVGWGFKWSLLQSYMN